MPLADKEHPIDETLIANVAVSTRGAEDGDDAGNKFSVMYATLGTNIADPAERLTSIHSSTLRGKQLIDQMDASRDTTLSAIGPPLLVDALGRIYRAARLEDRVQLIGNVGVSNVVGPPMQLFICGAPVRSMFVFGPLMLNSTINCTAVSNADSLDVGITSSPGVVPDLYGLSAYLEPALDEVAESFGLTQ
jgi:diacylglycerol O-acyltransferase / wax synthase